MTLSQAVFLLSISIPMLWYLRHVLRGVMWGSYSLIVSLLPSCIVEEADGPVGNLGFDLGFAIGFIASALILVLLGLYAAFQMAEIYIWLGT